MRLHPKFILILSVVTAILGFSFTFNTLNSLKKGSIPVVVATRDLNVGETIVSGDLRVSSAPRTTDQSVTFRYPEKVSGKILRNTVKKGQMIKTLDLVSDNDDISGLIPQGYRAATIALTLSKETVKYLKFGTRVDVIFANTSNPNLETKTIMRNVFVIRVSSAAGGGMGAGPGQTYVTLAVKPEAAETLAYAMNRGKINLSIRPIEERNTSEEFVTLSQLLGTDHSIDAGPGYQAEIEIIKGVKRDTVRL